MNKKEEIKKLLITRMEVKAELNKLRFLEETTNHVYRHTIDHCLDLLKEIDKIIEELKKE